MEIYCIRKAKLNDIESIAIIKVMGWQSAYRGIVDDEYLNSMSISEQIEILKKTYSLENIFVAEKDNEILGFCRFCIFDNPVNSCIDCEIREIYVMPNRKRIGIGSKLFNYTLNYFKHIGKKKLLLGCFKENYEARKFYEKMGGIVKGEEDIEVYGKKYPLIVYIYDLGE